MKHWVWILVLAATAADAGEYWDSCKSCSARQAQAAALRTVPATTPGLHDVYIADFDREALRKYRVLIEFDAESRSWLRAVVAITAESHVQHEFGQVVSAMKADVASLEPGKPVPDDIVGSAYDLVHSSVNRQRVASYIIGHMSLWESIGAPVFVPLSLFRKVVDLNLTISVSFADGSTARFVLTGIEGSLGDIDYVFELVEGSARDADGNVIPDSAAEAAPFEGAFSSESGARQMVSFIQTWYAAPSGPVITCTSKQDGNNITVTCRRI